MLGCIAECTRSPNATASSLCRFHQRTLRTSRKTSPQEASIAGEYTEGRRFRPSFRIIPRESRPTDDAPDGRRPNLTPDFVETCTSRWGLDFVTDGTGDLETTFGPEDVLHYAYALFHSPTYRRRYEELLRRAFPSPRTSPCSGPSASKDAPSSTCTS